MTLPRGVFGIFWKFWISTEISYFCVWKKNFRKIHRVYTYQTTFGHLFHLLPFIFHQPTLVHGFLTSLPRGVFDFFLEILNFNWNIVFSTLEKRLWNIRVCMLIRQPSVIDLKYYHSFPASQTWYTASSHHYPEGCLEFFGNFEFPLKYRISAFEKNLE